MDLDYLLAIAIETSREGSPESLVVKSMPISI